MLTPVDKKSSKLQYKASRPSMGVYLIRNMSNGKLFVGSTLNLRAVFNSIQFKLNAGAHPSKSLEYDWRQYGPGNFEFEVLEEVFPRDNPAYDYASDLETLEDLWLEKLQPFGEKGYNEKKKTREERLRMIAANRKI
jgi:hypothetical protein